MKFHSTSLNIADLRAGRSIRESGLKPDLLYRRPFAWIASVDDVEVIVI